MLGTSGPTFVMSESKCISTCLSEIFAFSHQRQRLFTGSNSALSLTLISKFFTFTYELREKYLKVNRRITQTLTSDYTFEHLFQHMILISCVQILTLVLMII